LIQIPGESSLFDVPNGVESMFRFTIRDLLWLTVVVALALGWWVDRSRLAEVANLANAVRAYHRSPSDYP
jgi:hypothetical protein